MTHEQAVAELLRMGRVDVDNYPSWGKYQCVDLTKKYINLRKGVTLGTCGNAGAWIYRLDGLKDVTTYEKNSTWGYPRKGDIIVFRNHVAVCDGGTLYGGWIVEQNGSTGNGKGLGGDAIRRRWKTYFYREIQGWLHLK